MYTVGMEDWIKGKTEQITKTQKFFIDNERDIELSPDMSLADIQWENFKFILFGIIYPVFVVYIFFFMIFIGKHFEYYIISKRLISNVE